MFIRMIAFVFLVFLTACGSAAPGVNIDTLNPTPTPGPIDGYKTLSESGLALLIHDSIREAEAITSSSALQAANADGILTNEENAELLAQILLVQAVLSEAVERIDVYIAL